MAIYLLHGDSKSIDPFLIKRRLDQLLDGIDREGNLNFATFDLNETGTSFHDVVTSALTIPFLGGQRVVVARGIKGVEKKFKKPDEGDASEPVDKVPGGSAEQIIRSVESLGNLPEDALLILIEETAHLDKRTAFFRALKKAGCESEEFKAMWFDPASDDTRNAVKFIQAEASRLGIRLDTRAADRFALRVGADRGAILKELEKLAIYTGPGTSPTIEDIENVVTESYEAGIFHLVDVIGQGKTSEAIKVLADLMDRGAAPPYILTMIARQVRLIARVREAKDQGTRDQQMAKKLGESPFVVNKVLKQSRYFRRFKYAELLEYMMETDVHLKRGTMPPKLALETLIARLVGAPGERPARFETRGRNYNYRSERRRG